MCKPKEEGGQRCATHARPLYVVALRKIVSTDIIPPKGTVFKKGYKEWAERVMQNSENSHLKDMELLRKYATYYATTQKGIDELALDIELIHKAYTHYSPDVLILLRESLKEGMRERSVNRATGAAIKKARLQAALKD
jgi:hypothetical protein